MEEKYIKTIKECYNKEMTLAGTTSWLYHSGYTGEKYMGLRKIIKKERQRLDGDKSL
jgi:hypothetical protein